MEEIDAFCEYLTQAAAEMLSGGPVKALVQADDDERIWLTALVPEEFTLTVELSANNTLAEMIKALSSVQDFTLNNYRGNLYTEPSW